MAEEALALEAEVGKARGWPYTAGQAPTISSEEGLAVDLGRRLDELSEAWRSEGGGAWKGRGCPCTEVPPLT